MTHSILIKGGTILTVDSHDSIVGGDLLIRNARIVSIGETGQSADVVIDAEGCAVLPGFIQTHVHLCQTLFRGSADDLSLLDWLKKRVWPMEAAHTPSSIAASARLGIAEMIKGGTTCALTMETVNHTEEVFEVVEETGFRAIVGKCMMDKGDEVPAALHEQTEASIEESLRLLQKWHGKDDGRIRYCFAPRFALSCTKELLARVGELAHEHGVMIHTHASENKNECAIVEQETGLRNIAYLNSVGVSGPTTVLAHCVHLDDAELTLLHQSQTNVAHCPSSNLKLGSGIAPIATMLERGISVSLGADGAACNNRLDMFTEMRTMALLQKALHGPEAIPSESALRLATIGGAKALGLDNEVGSLEMGKRADVTILELNALHSTPNAKNLASAVVYSSQPADVRTVIVNGGLLMQDRKLQTLDETRVVEEAESEASELAQRARITS